jgi:hypothetical protein
MQKRIWRTLVLAALLGAPLTLVGTKDASAGVNVDIHIGLPPAFAFHAPPSMVVIPGTYVYLVPDIEANILFYNGYWYRPYEGRWYSARSYNGPWAYLGPRSIPRALVKLPQEYRNVPRGYHRIPYAQVQRNWGKWEHERHWDRDRDWRKGWNGHEKGSPDHERGRDRQGRGNDRRG